MIIPDNLLVNKKILLGVTGSIAVYKSLELTRLFIKAGAQVRVVMSESAKKFVTPLSFETLSSNKVLDDTNESWIDDTNHIKTSQWADIFIIAPATANTIAKLSNAIADTILLQCALAFAGKKLLCPSANTHMIENPITQSNIKLLQTANYEVVNTQIKELACKTTGNGAMAEPLDIFWHTSKMLLHNEFYQNRSVIVTGGGTIEKIDDVRYISNFSSGKMASSMASALYCKGANVKLIATRFENNIPKGINLIKVQSSSQMMKSIEDSIEVSKVQNKHDIQKIPYLFMAAAVSDYIPKAVQDGKLKKEKLGDVFNLELKKNKDILASVKKQGIVSIGFKAEMNALQAKDNAIKMLHTKNLQGVCLNILKDSSSFGLDTNTIEFISTSQTVLLKDTDKLSLAFEILKHAQEVS